MTRLFMAALAAMISLAPADADARSSGKSVGGSHYVSGHVTKKGKYVQGHMQSDPNGSRFDNHSAKGNVNPYTGKPGTKNPLP